MEPIEALGGMQYWQFSESPGSGVQNGKARVPEVRPRQPVLEVRPRKTQLELGLDPELTPDPTGRTRTGAHA